MLDDCIAHPAIPHPTPPILTTTHNSPISSTSGGGARAQTSYQLVLSHAHWSSLRLACTLLRYIVRHVLPAGPILLAGDDPVDGHPGRHIYG